ncbi:transglutaminase family protein [Nocardiopsis terrae]|nr:DUF3488 and transglutaminase-like domain-containing protein [Nocardiopsis terrae]
MPLAALVSMLAALPLLGGLVRGGDWWVPAALLMAATTAVSALYRLSGRNSLPVPFLQVFAAALLFTPLFAPGTGFLGVVPTPATFGHAWALFEQGVHNINVSAAPVVPSEGLRMIIALTFLVFAVTSDFLAVTARCPGMVGGLLLALLVVPLTVDDAGLTWVQAGACAAGFLALLATDMWVRSRSWGVMVPDGPDPVSRFNARAVRLATVGAAASTAIVLALVLPLAVPSLRTDAFYTMADDTQFGSGDNVTTTHPLVSLRRDLASSSDRTVLTYRSDSDSPEYLRTYVLDAFDGENWTMSPVYAGRDSGLDDVLPLPEGWEQDTGTPVTTQVSLESDAPRMEFLPLPYPTRSVEVSGDWYVDSDTLMVFTTDTPPTGFSFTAESARTEPDAEALAGAGVPRSLSRDYLDLPRDLDESVRELTDSLTENADSAYQRATALQDFFTGGSFTYDLSPPSVPGGADPLVHFLMEDRIGYCEQFAGAMAIMARQADIPARVAVGYTAGEQMGDGRWAVSVGDAHAWPELYFEGTGWVRFEPTPSSSRGQGSASVPEYTSGADVEPAPIPDTEPSERDAPEPSETDEEEPRPAPEESGSAEEEPTEAAGDTAGGAGNTTGMPWQPVVGGLLGGLLLLAAPALARGLVRWSRRSALASPGAPGAHTAWRELRDTCIDLGVDWSLTESPRATALRLSNLGRDGTPLPADVRAALWRLALAEEAARYAPDPAGGGRLAEDLGTARSGLAAAAAGGDRWRAVLLPRSLAPWRRPRIEAAAAPAVP